MQICTIHIWLGNERFSHTTFSSIAYSCGKEYTGIAHNVFLVSFLLNLPC